jgi:NADH-quinone oxidoreductase subunit G
MPTIKLDGREIPFEKGDTIIRAAWRQGLEIPHYCWHPGLSVAANCRMCLVEIGRPGGRPMMLDVLHWDEAKGDYVASKKPKLEPACQVECLEGMDVKSDSSAFVADARKHVQEYLLLNHPVDCPICDQAGECKLQDYWLQSQRALKRMHDEIVHKPKGVSFGPTIVYDAERCIVCTRCVRFMDEVAKDPVLDKRERGNLGEIVLSPGRQLDGKYTMMVDHVCPVGALTTKDFRFKARVWFLRKVETVCTGCATGCNAWLDYDPRTGEVPRIRPRDNLAVNNFWMCDDGILTHKRVHQGRLASAIVGRGKDRKAVALTSAIETAAAMVKGAKGTAVVLSAQRSTEDNFALAFLAKKLGSKSLHLAKLDDWDGDEILRDADHNPNVRGAKLAAGEELHAVPELAEPVVGGQVSVVIALGGQLSLDDVSAGALGRAKLIVLSDVENALTKLADVVLPIASWAEQDGSFVNRQGLEQKFVAGPRPLGDSLPGWDAISRLAKAAGQAVDFKRIKDVRKAMTATGVLPATSSQPTAPEAPPAE